MNERVHAALMIAVISAVTIGLRFLPFILFRKHTPRAVLYLGRVLPYSIMGMLVVYCLRNTDLFGASHGIPEAIAAILVIVVHKWKHSTLLSILTGTVAYMLMVQLIF